MKRPAECANCPTCQAADRADANYVRARRTLTTVICAKCGDAHETTVGYVLTTKGLSHCGRCGKLQARMGRRA